MGMCECADTSCTKLFHCKIAFYQPGLLAWGEEPGNNGEFKLFTLVPKIWQVQSDCRTESLPPHWWYITGRIHLRSIVSFCYFNFSLMTQPKAGYSNVRLLGHVTHNRHLPVTWRTQSCQQGWQRHGGVSYPALLPPRLPPQLCWAVSELNSTVS